MNRHCRIRNQIKLKNNLWGDQYMDRVHALIMMVHTYYKWTRDNPIHLYQIARIDRDVFDDQLILCLTIGKRLIKLKEIKPNLWFLRFPEGNFFVLEPGYKPIKENMEWLGESKHAHG